MKKSSLPRDIFTAHLLNPLKEQRGKASFDCFQAVTRDTRVHFCLLVLLLVLLLTSRTSRQRSYRMSSLILKPARTKGRASHKSDHFWADPVLPGCIFISDSTRLLAPELCFNFFNLRMRFSRSFADKPVLGTTEPWSNTIPTRKLQGASVNELQLGPMQHQMGFLPGSVRAAMGFSRCSRPTSASLTWLQEEVADPNPCSLGKHFPKKLRNSPKSARTEPIEAAQQSQNIFSTAHKTLLFMILRLQTAVYFAS